MYKKAKKDQIQLDPNLILITVIFISIVSMHVAYYIRYQFTNTIGWVLWVDPRIFEQITLINTIFTVSTTIFYLMLDRYVRTWRNLDYSGIIKLRNNSSITVWALVYLFCMAFTQVLKYTNNIWLWSYWESVVDVAFYIFVGSLIIRIKNIRILMVVIIALGIFQMFIFYPILTYSGSQSDFQYQVNKGGPVALVIFMIVFSNYILYKGRLINARRTLLGIIMVPIFLAIGNQVEAVLGGSDFNLTEIVIYILQGYELRMLENQAIIINDIKSGALDYEYGATYIKAIKDLINPFSGENSLGLWFTDKLKVSRNDFTLSGMNFSFIAEGYLNYGKIGIVFQSLIAAVILILIKLTLKMKTFYSAVIFSIAIVYPYYIYRTDLFYMAKKIQFLILSFLIISVIYRIFRVLPLRKI